MRGVELCADTFHGQAAPGSHVARVPAVDVVVAHPVGNRSLAASHALEQRDHLALPPRDVRQDLADAPRPAPRPPHRVVGEAHQDALERAELVVGLPQEIVLLTHAGSVARPGVRRDTGGGAGSPPRQPWSPGGRMVGSGPWSSTRRRSRCAGVTLTRPASPSTHASSSGTTSGRRRCSPRSASRGRRPSPAMTRRRADPRSGLALRGAGPLRRRRGGRTRVVWVRAKTFRVEHELSVGDRRCAEGFEVRAWVARPAAPGARLRALPIPPEVISRLQGQRLES